MIDLTIDALNDLTGIQYATAVIWGEGQAQRYERFLHEALSDLAQQPHLGAPTDGMPGAYVSLRDTVNAAVPTATVFFIDRLKVAFAYSVSSIPR